MTNEQFSEWSHDLAESNGFHKIEFNLNKFGVTFDSLIDFDIFFDKNMPSLSDSKRKNLLRIGAYFVCGKKDLMPRKSHVDFWIEEWEPSLSSTVNDVCKTLETVYIETCNKIFKELKNSELWTML